MNRITQEFNNVKKNNANFIDIRNLQTLFPSRTFINFVEFAWHLYHEAVMNEKKQQRSGMKNNVWKCCVHTQADRFARKVAKEFLVAYNSLIEKKKTKQ